MFVGTLDDECSYKTALEIKDTIGDSVVAFTTFEGVNHYSFDNNLPCYVKLVIDQLQVPVPGSPQFTTVTKAECDIEGEDQSEYWTDELVSSLLW